MCFLREQLSGLEKEVGLLMCEKQLMQTKLETAETNLQVCFGQ